MAEVATKTVVVSGGAQTFTDFLSMSVCNVGAGTATLTGLADGSAAVNLGAGQAASFPEDKLGNGYQGLIVDGTSSTCHVILVFYN